MKDKTRGEWITRYEGFQFPRSECSCCGFLTWHPGKECERCHADMTKKERG